MELAYLGVARAGSRYLTRGEPAAAIYVRGGLGTGDFFPGLSDVDLAIVFAATPEGAARRARTRWQHLHRKLPAVALIIDWPRIYDEAELLELAGASAFTYGLDSGRASYSGSLASLDTTRMLERPGLRGSTVDWRLLRGPDRRPPARRPDAQDRRVAAWLEVVYWWRLVVGFCVQPSMPRTADVGIKFVAESARIWLWLVHGEHPATRTDALRRAIVLLPEEEETLGRALKLRRTLGDAADSPLADLLPCAVRLSARIAARLAAEVEDQGITAVRLAGAELVTEVDVQSALPLADWRAIACRGLPDETFVLLDGSPGDPAVLAAAATAYRTGPYPALLEDGLMVMPTLGRQRTRLRGVKCPVTDPVAFAVAAGTGVAAFPDVRGWSARDTALRAVAEHRASLGEQMPPGHELGLLLTAARAALFLTTIAEGHPELCLTATETARRLESRAADEALDRHRQFVLHGAQPPAAAIAALRRLVLALPAYQARDPLHH